MGELHDDLNNMNEFYKKYESTVMGHYVQKYRTT